MARPLRIAFFYERPVERMPPFVRYDYEAACQIGEVRWAPAVRNQHWRRVIGPAGWFPSREVVRLVGWCDVAIQWFANAPAAGFVAKILGKPLLVIPGGYDVANLPECGYGMMIDRRTRALARTTLRLATLMLAFSQFSRAEAVQWAPSVRSEVLPLGFDADLFNPAGRPERRVITVGRVSYDWVRKGLKSFVLAAGRLPDVPFVVLGPLTSPQVESELRRLAPANVSFLGGVPHAQVVGHLQRSLVYAQLSLHESFCCAIAEGMLCGCTPVATRAAALPEVVGDAGYYAEPDDVDSAAEAISLALDNPDGRRARERIVNRFPLTSRIEGIQGHLRSLAHG